MLRHRGDCLGQALGSRRWRAACLRERLQPLGAVGVLESPQTRSWPPRRARASPTGTSTVHDDGLAGQVGGSLSTIHFLGRTSLAMMIALAPPQRARADHRAVSSFALVSDELPRLPLRAPAAPSRRLVAGTGQLVPGRVAGRRRRRDGMAQHVAAGPARGGTQQVAGAGAAGPCMKRSSIGAGPTGRSRSAVPRQLNR